MKNLFNLDNPFFQLLTGLANLFLVNVLFLLCCVPIFTIGASCAAAFKTVKEISEDTCGGICKTFFAAFRANFKQATGVWLTALVVLAALVCDFLLLRLYFAGALYTILLAVLGVLAFLCISVLCYMFPLIGHFENKVKEHLFNALILTIVHFPRSLGMVALHILPLALALFAPQAFIYTLLLWVMTGFSFLFLLDAKLLAPVFEKLENMANN